MSAGTSSVCGELVEGAGEGVAPALRAVDCMSGEATAMAFGRLLGPQGALLPALSVVLALYVALFAVALLTGRARLGARSLVPMALKVGLVLTFATSWLAYQSVVWTLATGAPDQIASLATGTRGSATQIFAGRVDTLFAAIGEASAAANEQAMARASAEAAPGMAAPPAPATAGMSPAALMWLGATVLLLGTVGVVVTARIVLALLLMVGPVFVVLALFSATRGLCAGWLRATMLAALAPLVAVIGGAFTLELAVPTIARLVGPDGIDARSAMAFFLVAAVHAALMVMALRTAGTIVNGWRVFGSSGAKADAPRDPAFLPPLAGCAVAMTGWRSDAAPALAIVASAGGDAAGAPSERARARSVTQDLGVGLALAEGSARARASGIGSRFRSAPAVRRMR